MVAGRRGVEASPNGQKLNGSPQASTPEKDDHMESLGESNDNIPADELRFAAREARIAVRNAKFAALTPERKRTTIARDVLKWLKLGRLKASGYPGCGGSTYLSVYDGSECNRVGDTTLQETGMNGFSCIACAVGGLIAAASYRNACKLHDESGNYLPTGPGNDPTAVSIGRELAKAGFDVAQVLLVEQAYEVGEGIPDPSRSHSTQFGFTDAFETPPCTEAQVKAARAFGQVHEDRTARMEAIMLNIIANRGTFVP